MNVADVNHFFLLLLLQYHFARKNQRCLQWNLLPGFRLPLMAMSVLLFTAADKPKTHTYTYAQAQRQLHWMSSSSQQDWQQTIGSCNMALHNFELQSRQHNNSRLFIVLLWASSFLVNIAFMLLTSLLLLLLVFLCHVSVYARAHVLLDLASAVAAAAAALHLDCEIFWGKLYNLCDC